MNVGDLRRFIAGSPDNRVVDVVVLGAGVQNQVSLQNYGPGNLTITVRVSSGLQQVQAAAPDDAGEATQARPVKASATPSSVVNPQKEPQKDAPDEPHEPASPAQPAPCSWSPA